MQAPSTQNNGGWDPSWWPTHTPESWAHLVGYLLMALGTAALVWAAAVVVRRLVRWLRPVRLFVSVGRAMGLSYAECWWLWRVARSQQLGSPLTLLMSPETLRFHGEAYAARRHGGGRFTQRLKAIRRRLFGSS